MKQWFDNYLKGVIEYRGVKTPQVTSLVQKCLFSFICTYFLTAIACNQKPG